VHFVTRTRLAACAAAVLLAGCQSASHHAVPGNSGPGTTPHSGGGRSVAAAEADNGHTISVAVGDVVVLALHSTYWQVVPLAPGAALRATGPASVAASRSTGCPPGQGCGTVTASFQAVASGRVVITASRSSCGEALRCTGAAGSYRLSVVIT